MGANKIPGSVHPSGAHTVVLAAGLTLSSSAAPSPGLEAGQPAPRLELPRRFRCEFPAAETG